MERVRKILARTANRYWRYLQFGEISEREYKIRMKVLEEIADEIEGLAEETYDG